MYGGGGYPAGMGTITVTSTGVTSLSSGDVMGFWLDLDNNKLWITKNGAFINSGNPATGANPQANWASTGTQPMTLTTQNVSSGVGILNTGSNPSFNGTQTAGTATDKNGFGLFKYDPSGTDFIAMCSGNIPTATAVSPAETDDDFPQKLFGILKYTGNGSQRTISTAFQFDWLWSRSSVQGQNWYNLDTNRGIFGSNNYYLKLDVNDAEADLPQDNYVSQTASGSDAGGYVLSSGTWFNSNGHTQINWFWRANGGSLSSDTSGNITSVGQKDPSGCFSIVTYTGSGTANQTIAHHLDQAPIANYI